MLSDNNKIKIAIIGLGKMGGYHLNALRILQKGQFESYYKGDSKEILSRIDICGLCDTSSEKLKTLLDVEKFSDYHKLINLVCPDIVIVATPTKTHFEIAKFALEKGANVFVEKPIVVKKRELNELLEIAARKKLKLMAGHVERYNPVSMKLREVLLGFEKSKKSFSFTRVQSHNERIEDDIITDKLIHDLDLSLFLFGQIKNYEILNHKKISGKIYELKLRTEHENGIGEIFVSWLKNRRIVREVKLEVENKLIEGDFLKKALKIDGSFVNCDVPRWIEAQNNQVKDELVDFVVHCFSKSPNVPEPLLNIKEILCTVKIIEEISDDLMSDIQS